MSVGRGGGLNIFFRGRNSHQVGVRMHIFCESPFFAEGPRDFYAMLNPIILWHFVGGGSFFTYSWSFFANC